MMLVVPDLLFHAVKYVESTKILLKNSLLPDDRSSHDDFLKTIFGAYFSKKRYGAEHYYMYNFPTLLSLLKSVGFQNIENFGYKEEDDGELSSYDFRPLESLHLEVRKKI